MANQNPVTASQQQLQSFVSKYRLERASLGTPGNMITFYMNPNVTQTNQWLINYQATGSGYARQTFGPQYYTIQLQGTTGIMGQDSGNPNVGGMKQLYRAFAPGWAGSGNGNQNKRFLFVYPAMGLRTLCYVDSFTRSMTSQPSLYIFFTMNLTVLPPKIAQDYEPLPAAASGLPGSLNAANVAPGVLIGAINAAS